MNQLTISSRITPNSPENIPKSLEFIVSFVTVMVPGQQAREITLKLGDLKSKSRWPTKRFRAIGRSLSLSADPLIDLFDLTAGGGGYETTAGFTVERPYRLFIAADPEIPIDIGIENGTKASFWWLARYNVDENRGD